MCCGKLLPVNHIRDVVWPNYFNLIETGLSTSVLNGAIEDCTSISLNQGHRQVGAWEC